MKHQDKPIIIIRKRKHKGHGGAHGSWKIAYADFMTAMMAFFLVMWLISMASPSQLVQIADYFRTPLAEAITGGHRISDSVSPIPGGGDDVTRKEGEVKKEPEKSTDADKLKQSLLQQADAKRLKKLHSDLDQLIEADPILRALRPHLRIDMVKEGLRIQIVDSQKRPMFKLGSAEVEPYMRSILRAIAPVLNTIPNKITISGHTDDLPYARGERSYSNWELSADRANASRRELVFGGLDEGKVLRVVGTAATMNLSAQADDPLNRRISLIVLNKQAEQEILQDSAQSGNTPLDALKAKAAPVEKENTDKGADADKGTDKETDKGAGKETDKDTDNGADQRSQPAPASSTDTTTGASTDTTTGTTTGTTAVPPAQSAATTENSQIATQRASVAVSVSTTISQPEATTPASSSQPTTR